MNLLQNLTKVKERIEQAAKRVGRDPSQITLVAVTKEAEPEQIKTLFELGVLNFAENYAQSLIKKYEIAKDAVWHFIGRIQTNKVKYIVPRCEYIHSVWRLNEIETINKVAEKLGKIQKILVEVNVSQEETKAGITLEEAPKFVETALNYPNVSVVGLMTMAPFTDDENLIRSVFRKLRELRDKLVERFPTVQHLSMGMTNDFEIAVEEGATMVRIGRALFKGEGV
ncbi:YggS family pyridoxal phosphate-dependent enzyme [Pseudothermotoga thermarum]|uniref:Pyridoxal phosphate homeostasis protein n=1 Tax=Pseudothermotoga thermarum DSM 5069 TaxID=688269 RepID=F7YXK0_9THEM|nr:YggS family pyridoxal phosphate-dependent enzyme [Pseudothermotoga thermarum]AEH50641.1 alanine racemase domain protein [Pseudothermotoga thermarum DSM 5069]